MKIFLIDEYGLLRDKDLDVAQSPNIEVVKSLKELSKAEESVFFANKVAAKEYFGTDAQRSIKYQGERFENFQYGAALPDFDHTIADPGERIRKFFIDAFKTVDEYNKQHKNVIQHLIYNIDEMVLSKEKFVEYFDRFLGALHDFKAN